MRLKETTEERAPIDADRKADAGEMQETLLSSVFDSMPEPMLIATLDRTIRFANSAARAMFSAQQSNIVGKPLRAILAGYEEKFGQWLNGAACSSSFVSARFELATCQGATPFLLEACLISDPNVPCFLVRIKSIDASQTLQSLETRVDMLQKEIAMRRAAEAKLQESLLELELAKRQLEELATIDSLTGIPNRRSIDETLRREWAKAMRNAEPLAAIMIDIDHFKNYNDSYGHQAGDLCLKQVAAAIQATLRRSTDFVGRYGGEEFLVLLENSNWEKASQMAQKICDAVRQLGIPHSSSNVATVVTVSAGVNVTIPTPTASLERFIGEADAALYQAKRNGRQQFVLRQKTRGSRLPHRHVRT